MSPISNHAQRISIALERAAALGMSSEDVDRWRRNLDRAADDICGCRASFVALTAALAAGVVVQFVLGFGFGSTGLSVAGAFVAAVIAKGAQSMRVQTRFRRELASFTAQIERTTLS